MKRKCKYGLIGEHLSHSFSRDIHEKLYEIMELPYSYELIELTPDEVGKFVKRRKFRGINVTIPYKEKVIPFLNEIDSAAREVGSVNTVVKRGLKLIGYNTDLPAMQALIKKAGLSLKDKKVVILGSGGTSKTAQAAARLEGARRITVVSREPKGEAVSYSSLYELYSDAQILINTTPLGMFPNVDGIPAELSRLPMLEGVIDVIYNPIRTRLIIEAEERGIKAAGGLYMLLMQAFLAEELFLGEKIDELIIQKVYKSILRQKRSIALIGMPGSGKSTVAEELKKAIDINYIDTDKEIEKDAGKSISEIFKSDGESAFRELEKAEIANSCLQNGIVIATGGGAVLDKENIIKLKQNAIIYFLDRPLSELLPTDDRPLAKSREDIERLYRERYEIYNKCADVRIEVTSTAKEAARDIISDFMRRR